MKKLILSLSLLLLTNISGNMDPKTGFIPFPNYYFVETGTYDGNGIRFALQGNFKEIHSVEIADDFFERAVRRFANDPKVKIWKGNSGECLWDIIKDMDKPITFWLDGHNGFADPNGGKNTPLMEELDQIKRHPIKNHTIIIDDMHCCGTNLFDYLTREDIVQKVLEVNPAYTITFIAGGDDGEYPENILVAQVK